jgi:hypothetical protein
MTLSTLIQALTTLGLIGALLALLAGIETIAALPAKLQRRRAQRQLDNLTAQLAQTLVNGNQRKGDR